MSESLKKVWQQIEKYLSDGISVIPVADRELNYRGKTYAVKQPLVQWKAYQEKVLKKEELFAIMDDAFTTAVAIICGKISGKMEVIDVDVKYQAGIDATLFQDIKLLYPALFKRLRIHKSPSGGYHIPYRISSGEVPGNRKLASRHATEYELTLSKEKTKAFIETRGEGGYILAPPSMGYEVVQDVPIPVLTWEERCSLIALCESYNQVIKVDKPYKPTRYEESTYDENPFEHYNNTCDPVALMENFGWKEFKYNSRFIWFTRPGKDKSVSASFNLQKKIFYIFTSSTELEPSRGYNPATLLAELQFAGDKKRTYAHLVESGYGKVKPQVEKRTVKMTALRGGKLPANFSPDAQQQLEAEVEKLQQQYPYGVFWFEEDEVIRISREGLVHVAQELGFALVGEELVRVEGFKVSKVSDRFLFDTMKAYIKEEIEKYRERIYNAYESFLQSSGKFTISRLPIIDRARFVRDDRDTCFKFYQNGFLAITAEGFQLLDYDTLHGLIWADQVQPRDFQEAQKEGKYTTFLKLALEYDANPTHYRKVIGWLAHEYKDETTGYIIAITEQCPDPKHGGGSGKNIFCALFRHTTSFMSIPGEQVKYDEKFLQSWHGEKIFCISDPDKRFKWSFLKELSTGVGIVKKLYHNEASLSPQDLPKFVVPTNFSFEISDGGLKRRIVSIEFTDYFTKSGGVDVSFGCHFPKGWTDDDWADFDTTIAKSVQEWLSSGLKLSRAPLTEGGWQKQFDQMYGQLTREFIQENWDYWLRVGFIANEKFREAYDAFCITNAVHPSYKLSSQKMNNAIEAWCEHWEVAYRKDAVRKSMTNDAMRGREFIRKSDAEQEELPF